MGNMFRSRLGAGGGIMPTGNAQPVDVLAGKTFSNAEGIDKVGTMVNNGAVSETLAAGESYTIPAGYHNGSGTISADSSNFSPNTRIVYNNTGSTVTMALDSIETSVSYSHYGMDIINFEGTSYTTITVDSLVSGFKAHKLLNGVLTDVTALTIDISDHPIMFIELTGGTGFSYTIS